MYILINSCILFSHIIIIGYFLFKNIAMNFGTELDF